MHGVWETTTLDKLLNKNNSCRYCANGVNGQNHKPDHVMVERFNKNGTYPEGTEFKRTDRVNSQGRKSYWTVKCGVCHEDYDLCIKDLHDGVVGCSCSKINTVYCYLFNITSQNTKCHKFGISSNPLKRAKDQGKNTLFNIKIDGVWKFPDIRSCRCAEKEVKRSVPRYYLNQEQYGDGWTETIDSSHIDEVINIYEKYGGIKV